MNLDLYDEVNLLDNKDLIKKINLWSIGVLLASVPVFWLISYLYLDLAEADLSTSDFFVSSILCFGILFIHEGIHGLFFKIFKPGAKVVYGFKAGMAYAGSFGNKYPANQFIWILLAPFTLITLGMLILTLIDVMSVYIFLFVGVIHTGGCIGDFYFTYLILNTPGNVIVEDTDKGINIYRTLNI